MSFDNAYRYTKKIEAGYANSLSDSGGETFMGISRVANPSWPGWSIVDNYKKELEAKHGKLNWHSTLVWRTLDKAVSYDKTLTLMVEELYRKNYWSPIVAYGFTNRLTEKLFDIHVNCGIKNMAKILQRAVNRIMPETLVEDGAIGSKTKAAVSLIEENALLKAVVLEQKEHYKRTVLKKFPNARQSFLERAEWLP